VGLVDEHVRTGKSPSSRQTIGPLPANWRVSMAVEPEKKFSTAIASTALHGHLVPPL